MFTFFNHFIGQQLSCNYCNNEVLLCFLLRKKSHFPSLLSIDVTCFKLLLLRFFNLPPNLFQQTQCHGKPGVLWSVDSDVPFWTCFPLPLSPTLTFCMPPNAVFCRCDHWYTGAIRQFLAFTIKGRTVVGFHPAMCYVASTPKDNYFPLISKI